MRVRRFQAPDIAAVDRADGLCVHCVCHIPTPFAAFTFLFGWSRTLWQAVITRFLTGLCGGIMIVSKTAIAEARLL